MTDIKELASDGDWQGASVTPLFTAPPLPEPACTHSRSKWNIQCTHGTCQDCGQELPEPAPQEAGFHDVTEFYKEPPLATPSSEEVREVVERLRCFEHPNQTGEELMQEAAELIERLAARVPTTAMEEAIAAGDGTLHGAIDYWQKRALKAEAARVPDGCVLVPREPTVQMLNRANATEWDGMAFPHVVIWDAMIAAGEVKL